MTQKVCDKCHQVLDNKRHCRIDVCVISDTGWESKDVSFDLCKECYKKVLNYILEKENNEQ